jgi:hypothetical protein
MFRLRSAITAPAALAALLLCPGLAAQDLSVSVREPRGDVNRDIKADVVEYFKEAISGTKGFSLHLFDDDSMTGVVDEGEKQKNARLVLNPAGSRDTKDINIKEADLMVDTTLAVTGGGALRINCQIRDRVSSEVLGAGNRVVNQLDDRIIREQSMSLMSEMLRRAGGKLSGGVEDRRNPKGPLDGLEGELKLVLTSNNLLPKWNSVKQSLEVQTVNVTLAENRQYGTLLYRVGGSVGFVLDGGEHVFAIEPFTESNGELIRKKIKDQVQPKANAIIRDLLSQSQSQFN